MTATILALLWPVIGAGVHLLTVEEDSGPWWLTVAVVMSWPIFLLAYLTNVHVSVGIIDYLEEGEDE